MKTVISVRTDVSTKTKAQAVAKDIGIPLSTLLNAYLRQLIASRSVNFSVEPSLRPEVEKELLRIEADIKAGRNLSPVFDNLEEAFKWLDA